MATERIDVVISETGAREVSRRIEDVGRSATRVSRPLLNMQRLLASYVSLEGLRRLTRLTDQFTEMENRIRVLDGTTQHYSVTLRRLYDISQETRSSLRDNVLLFQRMGLAQRELGATTEELFDVTRAVGQAIAIQGGLATTSAGAVLQLSQAFGSGRVQLEEFNSVITGLYPIAKAAAEGIDATGGSIARLRRMIADGEVDSRLLFRGILNSLDSLDEQFKQTVPTVSQSFTVLRNATLMYVGDLNTASGASEAFARGIISLSNNMDDVVKGAIVVGAALGPLGLTRIVLGLRAAFIALNVAIMANPFGAIATAISASITYLLLFNKNLDELAKKVDESATVVDRMGATWVGVLAYIKKAWEDFPKWFGGLIERAVDEGIKSLSKFGTRLFGNLEADIKQGEKILGFFGFKTPGYVNRAKADLPQFKSDLEDALNFDLPPGVIDRQKDNGSQAAQAFTDAYEDYLLRARHRRETLGGGGGGGGDDPSLSLLESKGGAAAKQMRRELASLLDAINPVEAAWKRLAEGQRLIEWGWANGLLSLEQYNQALGDLGRHLEADLFPIQTIVRDLEKQAEILQHEASVRERLSQIYAIELDLKRNLTFEERELLDAKLQMLQAAEREAQIYDEIRQPMLDYRESVAALIELFDRGAISLEEFNRKNMELRQGFLQTQTDMASGIERWLNDYTQKVGDAATQIEQVLTGAFKAAEDAFVKFVKTGKFDFKALADSIIADLARIAVQKMFLGPLANTLFGGGSFGDLFGGVLFGGGRAAGGPVRAGRFYEVNERQPELLTVGGRNLLMMGAQDGQVTPVSQTSQESTVINQNFYITTPDADSFRRSQSQLERQMFTSAQRATARA